MWVITRQTSTPSQVRDSYRVVSTRQACVSIAPCPSLLTGRHLCPHVFLSFLLTRTYLRATCLPVEYSVSSAKGLFIMPPAPPRLKCSCLPSYSSLQWSIYPPPFMPGVPALVAVVLSAARVSWDLCDTLLMQALSWRLCFS